MSTTSTITVPSPTLSPSSPLPDLEKPPPTTTTTTISTLRHRTHLPTSNSVPLPTTPTDFLVASRLADSQVPDGAYGWVIVAACAVNFWWALGTTYSWGVIQSTLVAHSLSTAATLSFIGGLMAAMISATGFLAARLVRYLGARLAAMLGVLFMGISGILSSFTTRNLPGLFVTAGAMMGWGIALTFMVVSVLPSQYFAKKRGMANGLIFAGGGFGGAAISVGLDALIGKVGLPWAYRILGLATLATGLPASCFIKERVKQKTPLRTFDWRLFKLPSFTILFLASAIGCFPLFVPPFFIPLYTTTLHFPTSTGAGLVAGFNLSSAAGRILCGLLCDRVGAVNTLLLSLILTTVSMLCMWPFSTTLGPMCVFVVVNGAANGGFFSIMPMVVSNVFGSARVASAMGIMVIGWLGGYLCGAPIAGYILDASGGEGGGAEAYRPAMYYGGALAFVAAVLVAGVRWKKTGKLLARF